MSSTARRPLPGRPLRIGTLNVHGFSQIHALADAVARHGPFDIFAIQEGGASMKDYVTFGERLGMRLAVRRTAEYFLANAIFVAKYGLDVTSTHEWDLQSKSLENRSAVAIVARRVFGSDGGGGGGAAAAGSSGGGGSAAAAESFLKRCRKNTADGADRMEQEEDRDLLLQHHQHPNPKINLDSQTASSSSSSVEQPIMFICTHLDAYEEKNRLDQVGHLRTHLRAAIAENDAAAAAAAAGGGGGGAPSPAASEDVDDGTGGGVKWWTVESVAALTADELQAVFVSMCNTSATKERAASLVITPASRQGVERGVLRLQAEQTMVPSNDDDDAGPAVVDDAGDKAWLEATPFVLMGDFNALKQADYTPAQWLWLTEKRLKHGIKSETWMTETIEAPIGASIQAATPAADDVGESEADAATDLGTHPGWGMMDTRASAAVVANVKGGNKPATSDYGARVDYVYGSPAFMAAWNVVEYRHIDMNGLTDHCLVVCDLLPKQAGDEEE